MGVLMGMSVLAFGVEGSTEGGPVVHHALRAGGGNVLQDASAILSAVADGIEFGFEFLNFGGDGLGGEAFAAGAVFAVLIAPVRPRDKRVVAPLRSVADLASVHLAPVDGFQQ